MDKDRVIGSAKQIKGTVKQVVGNAVGDAKLEAEGNADNIEGRFRTPSAASRTRLKENRPGANLSLRETWAVPVDVPAPIIILLVH
jgi:uncharacterized protein YjbJ (UPF0337 family)